MAADDGFFRTEARQFRGEYRDGQTPVCGALHKEGFMKRLAFLLLLIAVVSCGQQAATGPAPAQTAAESGGTVEAELLFVQEAEGVTFEGDTLTLVGVRPQVLFFTDRPQRVAGYLAFDEFLAEVSTGAVHRYHRAAHFTRLCRRCPPPPPASRGATAHALTRYDRC